MVQGEKVTRGPQVSGLPKPHISSYIVQEFRELSARPSPPLNVIPAKAGPASFNRQSWMILNCRGSNEEAPYPYRCVCWDGVDGRLRGHDGKMRCALSYCRCVCGDWRGVPAAQAKLGSAKTPG